MRLEKIRFNNINSLKGEHEIAFDEGPLSSAGLFAITGATGSGKSTILDVITLALYNYIPRMGKISKTSIEKLGSIVTHFTDEAWAEVEYTSNGQRYLSHWSISKARTGNFREYTMDLVLLPEGESLGLKKGEIPDKNKEIIGLSYDQFTKSILLSQGDFSKFLKASKAERSALLEDITGTHIYRQLGKMAYEKIKDKKNLVDQQKARIEEIKLIDQEQLSAYDAELKTLRTSHQELLEQSDVLNRIIQLKENQTILLKLQEEIERKKLKLQQFISAAEKNRPLLEKHEAAKEYEASIHILEQNNDRRKTLDQNLKNTTAKLKESEEQKHQSIELMSKLTRKHVTEKSFYVDMASFEKQINKLDADKERLQIKGVELRNRIIKLSQASPSVISQQFLDRIKAGEALDKIEQRVQQLNVSSTENSETLQKRWSELNEKSSIIKQHRQHYSQWEKFKHVLDKLQQDLDTRKDQLQVQSQTLSGLKQSEESITSQLKVEQEKLKTAKDRATLEDQRALLVDGKPCPLCGADHHPYAHDSIVDLGLITLDIHKLEQELARLNPELIQTQKNIFERESQIKIIRSQILDSKNSIDQSKDLVEKDRSSHSWLLQIADEKWDQELDMIQKEIELTNQKLQEFDESKFLAAVKAEFTDLDLVLNSFQEKQLQRTKLYTGTDINSDADTIQNKFTSALSSIESLGIQLLNINEEILEVDKNITIARKTLIPLMKIYGLNEAEHCSQLLLDHNNYRQLVQERNNIELQQTELKTLEKQQKQDQKSLEVEKGKLDAKIWERFGPLDAQQLHEGKKSLQKKSQDLNINIGAVEEKLNANQRALERKKLLEEELQKLLEANKIWILLNELIGDSTGKKFSNFAQDLTLVHLLTRANLRLESLTDRYHLSFRPNEDDLFVIDRYQGDTIRGVKTLSGGESFLISLALALSLSDFASNKVKLESLFIDEGFGTLDQETLDVAMSTLEKLQHNSGKKIGIISHVESLKERVSTQIHVNKSSQGYSTIEIAV